jgi:glycosyltransferase involved in cell wall biosynthesis
MSRPPDPPPLRVLVVTGSYPPEHTGSGLRIAATYTRLTARHPVTHRVLTLAPSGRPVPAAAPPAVRVEARGTATRLAILARHVVRFGRGADVAHLVGLTRETRVAAVVLRALGTPYTVEPSVDRTPERPPAWSPAGWVTRWTDRLLLGNHAFVALTSRIAALHDPHDGDRTGLHLRPNPYHREVTRAVEVAGVSEVAAPALPPRPAGAASYRHVVLGRLCPRKGHDQALTWLRHLPDEHTLVFAGPLKEAEDEPYLRRLEATIAADPRLRDRVTIVPRFVDPLAVLAEVDTVWIPSLLEGMPNVAVEAACQGAQVVLGDWLAAAEWFTTLPGTCVAVPADGPAAAAIAALCADRPPRAALAAAARERFDLDRHVDALHDHLRATAGSRQPSVAGPRPPAASSR